MLKSCLWNTQNRFRFTSNWVSYSFYSCYWNIFSVWTRNWGAAIFFL